MKNMKKWLTLAVAALLALAVPALAENTAAQARIASVEYKGFGIVEVDFTGDCDWQSGSAFTLTDGDGNALLYDVLGGDEDECYLQVTDLVENAACVLGLNGQNVGFQTVTGREYVLDLDDQIHLIYNMEPCDWCNSTAHDDDYCPEHWAGKEFVWTWQPNAGTTTQTAATSTTASATKAPAKAAATTAPQATSAPWCDECYEYGHYESNCPNERCDECGQTGHDDDRCPNERCDYCREYGHDDDYCPNRVQRCDECGQTGHDDDHCPNERCDECGKTGHDDDHCPNRGNHHGKGHHDD